MHGILVPLFPALDPMKCALCLEDRELVNSHIIPEFMYAALYDQSHRFHVLSLKPDTPSRLEQKGLREYLLCSTCDGNIGKHERYLSLLINGGIPLEFETHGKLDIVKGIDYHAVRMFQLSILWRAGVSTLPFFANVRLGSHQEKLRRLVLDDIDGLPWQYSCMMFSVIHNGELQCGVMAQPTGIRIHGVTGYRFLFGGFTWAFFVSSHMTSSKLELLSLDPIGELRVLKTDPESAEFVRLAFNELHALGRV